MHCRLLAEARQWTQVPADVEASEVIDSTLAEPIPTVAAMGSALHTMRRVQSDSEVPEVRKVTACCSLLTRFAIRYFGDLCRSPPQRAAAPEICLHMRCDPNTSYPRMRSRVQRNRSTSTLINMM